MVNIKLDKRDIERMADFIDYGIGWVDDILIEILDQAGLQEGNDD